MRSALDWLRETHGSIEAYTRTHGLTEAEIAALRDDLIEPLGA